MYISFGKDSYDTTPKGREVSFDQFVALFQNRRHHGRLKAAEYATADRSVRGRDKDGPWFIAGRFVPAERRTECLSVLTGFVGDFDNGVVTRQFIEQLALPDGQLHGVQFFAYTSYSHGVERRERWRIFIPYDQEIPPARHRDFYEHFNRVFDGNLDGSCAKTAQLWYLPGCPADAIVIAGTIVNPGRPFDTCGVSPAVDDVSGGAISGAPAVVVQSAAGRDANDDLTDGVTYAPPTLRDIVEMVATLPKADYAGYDPWLRIGMAIYHGTGGSDVGLRIFDRWSSTLAGYDPGLIHQKWASFGGRRSGITVGTLVHLARVQGWVASLPPSSAVDGGREQTPAGEVHSTGPVVPGPAAGPLVATATVTCPPRFKMTTAADGTLKICKLMPAADGTGRDVLTPVVTGYQLLRVQAMTDTETGVGLGVFEFRKPAGTVVVRIPANVLSSVADLVSELNNKSIFIYKAEEKQAIQELMMDWLKQVQKANSERNTVGKWGWVEAKDQIAGFAAGTTYYHADGTTEEDAVSCVYHDLLTQYTPVGTLEKWKVGANFIALQGRMPLVTILASAFAAPLVRLTGLDGVLLSVVSTKSGVGKSTAMQAAQAVWGARRAMHGTDDTAAAFGVKMGSIQNLPCYWDDIKGEQAFAKLPDLVYQITNGREKSRSNQQAGLNTARQWSTMATFASNDSILDRMRSSDTLNGSDATFARIFEIRLEERPGEDRKNAGFFDDSSRLNYGQAGAVYAAWLATNHAKASKAVSGLMAKLEDELAVTSEERFWVMAVATLVTGAAIARSLGLVDFDVASLRAYLTDQFKNMRELKRHASRDMGPAEVLRDMMKDLFPDTITIARKIDKRMKGESAEILSHPVKGNLIKAMHIVEDGVYRVRVSVFSDWMYRNRHSPRSILRTLVEARAAREGVLYDLGIGTPYAGPDAMANRVRVHEIHLEKAGLK